MRLPPWSFIPRRYLRTHLEPGHVFARAYDRNEAARKGYGPLDFNPTVSTSAKVGGRFDATPADEFAYLYGAETHNGANTALYETVLRALNFDETRGKFVAAPAETDHWSYQLFTLLKRLALVDLTTMEGLAAFGARLDLVQEADYSTTREWCRYIRRHTRGSAGLIWRSQKEQSYEDRVFVLFRDRFPKGNALLPKGEPVHLDSREGRAVLRKALGEGGGTLE